MRCFFCDMVYILVYLLSKFKRVWMNVLSFVKRWRISLVLVMFVGVACHSIKFDTESLKSVEKAYFETAIAGTTVTIFLKEGKTLLADSIYFRGRGTKLELSDTGDRYTGFFENFSQDLIMSDDVGKEYKNQVVSFDKDAFPFKLGEDECVIKCLKDQKPYYFKVQNLKKQNFL